MTMFQYLHYTYYTDLVTLWPFSNSLAVYSLVLNSLWSAMHTLKWFDSSSFCLFLSQCILFSFHLVLRLIIVTTFRRGFEQSIPREDLLRNSCFLTLFSSHIAIFTQTRSQLAIIRCIQTYDKSNLLLITIKWQPVLEWVITFTLQTCG